MAPCAQGTDYIVDNLDRCRRPHEEQRRAAGGALTTAAAALSLLLRLIQRVADGVVGVDAGIGVADPAVAVAGDGVESCCSLWSKFGSRFTRSAGSAGICGGATAGLTRTDGDGRSPTRRFGLMRSSTRCSQRMRSARPASPRCSIEHFCTRWNKALKASRSKMSRRGMPRQQPMTPAAISQSPRERRDEILPLHSGGAL